MSILFNIDVSIVQQYGIFIQQLCGFPVNFTIYLTENEVKEKKFIHRYFLICNENKIVKINIIYNNETEDVIIIPSQKNNSVSNIIENIDINVVEP